MLLMSTIQRYSLIFVLFSVHISEVYSGNVRLTRGDEEAGVVEVYRENQWQLLCGWPKVGNVEASVVCRELGFERGLLLPFAAYGPVDGNYSDPVTGCSDSSVGSILDCNFDEDFTPNVCETQTVYYTPVSCYNGSVVTETDVKIEDDESSDNSSIRNYGPVTLHQRGVYGQICSSYWSDADANVTCKQLGFTGGVALVYEAHASAPFLLTGVHCKGNESRLEECYTEIQICYSNIYNTRAGVLCYQSEGLHVRLHGDDPSYGTVVIEIDGESGTICSQQWSTEDATVVCRQLGFVTGYAVSEKSANVSSKVFLSDMKCNGAETSILMCPSSGWKNVNDSECENYANSAMIKCFDSVRLSHGYFTENVSMGIVEVYQKQFWTTLCGDTFDHLDATVVCRQLNFDEGQVTSSRIFGSPSFYTFTTSIECLGNESNILDCPHDKGSCPYRDYASVLCTRKDVNKDYTISMQTDSGGRVYVDQYGIRGTICRSEWDDVDAAVVCKQFGFKGGQVYGTRRLSSRYRPIWLTDVRCRSTDKSIYDCSVSQNISEGCELDMSDAGVICYNTTGMDVRLADGSDTNSGRVEVSRDSVWGTICDNKWSGYDSKVVCRQLGFADASTYYNSYHGAGTGPVYMDGLYCDGKERSIFHCPNNGWNYTASNCLDHTNDAGVYCFPWVQLSLNYFGAVQFWQEGVRYGKVCDDGFDANAASVVCREKGYQYAVPLCCSAFGPMDVPFTMYNVHCTGSEASLRDCQYDTSQPSCQSDNYASVYCVHTQPSTRFSVSLWNYDRGLVKVNYAFKDGLVCSDNFTSADADVICREKGFASGFSMKYYTPFDAYGTYVRWLNGMSCSGTENSVSECPAPGVGKLGHCDTSVSAGVLCSSTASSKKLFVRLQGGARRSEGRVELSIDGADWGALCAGNLTNNEASVICRQGGWRDGVALGVGSFGTGNTTPYLDYLRCDGTESKITDCVSEIQMSSSPCTQVSTVKCYETVRIVGSKRPEFGRVELWEGNKWVSVCDTGFDDTDARVICQYLGYTKGLSHCCSVVGAINESTSIALTNYSCSANHVDPTSCSYGKGVCNSGHYASVYCLDSATQEDISVGLPTGNFYGPVSVTRYGLTGYICDLEYDDMDAQVICKSLGYKVGHAVRTYAENYSTIIMGKLACSAAAKSIKECSYTPFGQDTGCYISKTVAGAICSNDIVTFGIRGSEASLGIPYITVNSVTLYIDGSSFDNNTAGVFCKSVGYAWGITQTGYTTTVSVIGVRCTGNETSLLGCKGFWDPSKKSQMISAYVSCHREVRLVGGGTFYGAVEVFKNGSWGTVCPKMFDDHAADVVCKRLKFEKGVPLCCSPFGFQPSPQLLTNVSCSGQENSILDCRHVYTGGKVACTNTWDYASVMCYNGVRGTDYSLKIRGTSFFSDVVVTYMNIEGRICQDNWDDNDAKVVCRQLNYVTGLAYNHYVEEGEGSSGPYWISNVNCTGQERSLTECTQGQIGVISECKSRHYAGVLCLDNQGLYYRISGGDPNGKSGRVEIYLKDVWGTICDTYWDQLDARVLCKQMGYQDGDPFIGDYRIPAGSGPIFETNYDCKGDEDSLNQCPHSGWYDTSSVRCQNNQNDAGVFCYETVKIYNNVGREKSSGPVLIYRGNRWFSVCDDRFDDRTARMVCQELGFFDGVASCCSSEGQIGARLWKNNTLQCQGGESSILQCLKPDVCSSNNYASVRCSYTAIPTYPSTTVSPTVGVTERVVQENNYLIAVVISVVVIIIAVIIIIIVIVKYRRSVRSRSPSGKYHPNILHRNQDGSFSAENPMHTSDYSSEVSFNQGNVVQYSPAQQGTVPEGFTNFAYSTVGSLPDDDSVQFKDTKPLTSDLTYDDAVDNFSYIKPTFSQSDKHPYDNAVNVSEARSDEMDEASKQLADRKEIPSPSSSFVKKDT